MLAKIRQALIGLTRYVERMEIAKELGLLAKFILKNRRKPEAMLAGMSATADFHAAETASWISAEQIAQGLRGPFDALDVLAYVEIAQLAGVAHVPAIPILALTAEEAEVASGNIDLSDKRSQRLIGRIQKGVEKHIPVEQRGAEISVAERIDPVSVREKLFAAMDDLPDGWMVRNVRSGGSNLKTLAGAGVALAEAPEVRFGPEVAVGPGWVRVGNRRMVDLTDKRTIEAIVRGPDDKTRFVARPWLNASRWRVGADPHRHGSVYAGKGAWPCEWRAFIVGGKVVGVANYYGWLGEATPLEARMALEARRLAQKMADVMSKRGLFPRTSETELARRHPQIAEALADFPRDGVACTIDFIETENGLAMLEGGPAHTPYGGGHCCAFAGTAGAPVIGNAMNVEGVAFCLLDGVILADMATWEAGRNADRSGRILPFAEVEALAAGS